jgi:hypothetical protein
MNRPGRDPGRWLRLGTEAERGTVGATFIKLALEPDSPKILRLVELTGRDVTVCFTCVVRWLFYVDQNLREETTTLTPAVFHALVGWPKRRKSREHMELCDALCEKDVDWLRVNEHGRLVIIDFERYFSASAKRRARAAFRQREHRSGDGDGEGGDGCLFGGDGDVTGVTQERDGECDGGHAMRDRRVTIEKSRTDPVRVEERNIGPARNGSSGTVTGSDRKGAVWVNAMLLELATALGLSRERYLGQDKPLRAVVRKCLNADDPDERRREVVRIAVECKGDPTLRDPVKAWQKQVNRVFAGVKASVVA